jgi:hypothetical protein
MHKLYSIDCAGWLYGFEAFVTEQSHGDSSSDSYSYRLDQPDVKAMAPGSVLHLSLSSKAMGRSRVASTSQASVSFCR